MVAIIQTAGESNPGRTFTDNTVKSKYPTKYKGFAVWQDRDFSHMLRVTKPDGSDFGMYSDERNYANAINSYIDEENRIAVSHMTRSEFEKNATP
jgi:hypothetical protein